MVKPVMTGEADRPVNDVTGEAEWLNLTQAAKRLGWSRERLRSMARRGRLQFRRGSNSSELFVLVPPERLAHRSTHGPTHRPTDGAAEVTGEAGLLRDRVATLEAALADAEAQVADLRVEAAKAVADREAVKAVAIADVTAARDVAAAEVAMIRAELAARDELVAELRRSLEWHQRPRWRRMLG